MFPIIAIKCTMDKVSHVKNGEETVVEVEELDNSRALSELSSFLQEYKSEWMFQLWSEFAKAREM